MPGILQQRIQVAALGRGGQQALERVGGEQHEQQEADADQAHHAQHARHHFRGRWRLNSATATVQPPASAPTAAASLRGRPRPPAMRYCSGSMRVGIAGDIQHREIVGTKGIRRGSRRRARRTRTAPAPPGAPAPSSAGCRAAAPTMRQHALRQGDAQREDQCKWPEFRNHDLLHSPSCRDQREVSAYCVPHWSWRFAPDRSRAAASGGM